MNLTFEEFIEFVNQVTFETSKILNQSFKIKDKYVTHKKDKTIVTEADLTVEKYIRSLIHSKFPEHSVIGEEFDDGSDLNDQCWVIDPIDGTYSYAKSVPFFGTLIGFMNKGIPMYGSMNLPILDNNTLVGDNYSCYLNGEKIKSCKFRSWHEALILTTDDERAFKSVYAKSWIKLKELAGVSRSWGDCYGYYLLCKGEADVMFDVDLKPYDILPIVPILHGAGVKIIDLSEEKNFTTLIACKPEIEFELRKIFLIE